jgi:glycerol-3-phosphate cytidylyltransferase
MNIYIIGVFDLFHVGHINFFESINKTNEDKIIVAINSDKLVAKYKREPIYKQEDRLKIVSSMSFVDYAFIIDSFDNREQVKKLKIDKIIHGDDWPRESYLSQICMDENFLVECNIILELVPYTKGVSTSEIIQRIREIK